MENLHAVAVVNIVLILVIVILIKENPSNKHKAVCNYAYGFIV